GLWAQQRLVESGGGLRALGKNVTLSCHGSGFIFENYDVLWYRRASSDQFEWVSYIDNGQGTMKNYATAVQGRATVSRDNSQSKSFLELQDLRPQDSARYFCAIRTQ
ncbi:HVM54 protein, partial [Atlantisia rogersi]|nr:HVM54 protein [Atlantisia rogersi]